MAEGAEKGKRGDGGGKGLPSLHNHVLRKESIELDSLTLTPVPLGSLQKLLRDPRPRSKLLPKEQAK